MKIEKIIRAYEFAKQAHGNQKRKNTGEPYIIHPVTVADIASNFTRESDTLVACFLHDVVEDTPVTLEQIKENFGEEVAFLVDGVTKTDNLDKTFQKLVDYSKKNKGVILIKLADRIHNLTTISEDMKGTIVKYKFWSPKYAEIGRLYGYEGLANEVIKLTKKLGRVD